MSGQWREDAGAAKYCTHRAVRAHVHKPPVWIERGELTHTAATSAVFDTSHAICNRSTKTTSQYSLVSVNFRVGASSSVWYAFSRTCLFSSLFLPGVGAVRGVVSLSQRRSRRCRSRRPHPRPDTSPAPQRTFDPNLLCLWVIHDLFHLELESDADLFACRRSSRARLDDLAQRATFHPVPGHDEVVHVPHVLHGERCAREVGMGEGEASMKTDESVTKATRPDEKVRGHERTEEVG